MNTSEQPNPGQDPGKKQGNPNETKTTEKPTNPGKPNNDPDQTPDREVNSPPVADPDKSQKPNKIGFTSDQYLLF